MNRASPIDLRKVLAMVDALTKAGILFVPMPVLNDADHAELAAKAAARLEQLAQEAEA
jgi:hypothetical protein